LTPSELTQRSMLADMRQQPMIWAGFGLALFALLLFWIRRRPAQERAARHLVRDWRHVDDLDDARDLLGSNVPTILRPALMVLLREAEDQVDHWFRQMERSISRM
ncbi:MAG TPA: hypothetical protein VFA49_00845, partial [Chloroflexota bacterium]|nr:hypothetical protein [Chloroflexota bacterium]